MPKLMNRNAPCWCGSGLKYKVCHFSSDMDDEIPPTRHLLGVTEKMPIWRIFKDTHFWNLVEDGQLVLVSPRLWDDPFENFLSRCELKINGRLVSLASIVDNFFAQCWTSHEEETDAAWRIYTPETTRGIRVQTTVEKLFDLVYSPDDPYAAIGSFIGQVQYLRESEIRVLLQDVGMSWSAFDSTGLTQARTLLIKRTAFSHEREVRVLKRRWDSKAGAAPDLFPISLNPAEFILDIVADPRYSAKEYLEFKHRLTNSGVECLHRQSTLYRVPRFKPLR